jgi:hypothetical protein
MPRRDSTSRANHLAISEMPLRPSERDVQTLPLGDRGARIVTSSHRLHFHFWLSLSV